MTLRALALSLGLHAAAAATCGGYQLGGYADSPPRLDVAGSAWVSISIRGEPGDAGSRAAGEGAANARGGPVAAPPAREPAPSVALPPPPSALPLVATAAPRIEAVVSAVGHTLEDAIELSIESLTHPPELDALPAPAVAQSSDEVSEPVADGGSEAGGGEAGAGVRGLGVGGHNQPPEYPPDARLAGQEGEVIVLALSDPSGAVEQASIEQSSGFPLLDEAALVAVRRWTFVPALEDGVAVAGYVRVPIRFVLRR